MTHALQVVFEDGKAFCLLSVVLQMSTPLATQEAGTNNQGQDQTETQQIPGSVPAKGSLPLVRPNIVAIIVQVCRLKATRASTKLLHAKYLGSGEGSL